MRTRFALFGVILALLVPAVPVAAASQTFHYQFSGKGGDAYWSTYPVDGAIVANALYRDTWISTSTQAYKADGTKANSTSVFINIFTYKVDRRGNVVPVSEVFAFIDGGSLTIDNKLSAATASASGPGDICTIDSKWNYNCTSGTVSITADWTGQGALVRGHGTGSFGVAGQYQSTYRGSYTYRDATARAQVTVNGSALDAGTNYYGSLYNFTQGGNDLYICRGC